MKPHDDRVVSGEVRLLRGRFEARFNDADAARAAARDTRTVGFVTDIRPDNRGWLIIGRRRLPFPGDERDRYASRFGGIAARHGGVTRRFVEEGQESSATRVAETCARGDL